ncbi:MAG: hypothetical protein WC628_00735 [Candidatus Omnitrophota bacterium]
MPVAVKKITARLIKVKPLEKVFLAGVILSFILSSILPPEAYAARSRAGGGEKAEADWGAVGAGVGMSIGMAVGTQLLSSAWNYAGSMGNTSSALSNTAQNTGNFLSRTGKTLGYLASHPLKSIAGGASTMYKAGMVGAASTAIKGFNTYTAAVQVSRAMAAAGNYYKWDRDSTYLASSIVSGGVGGFLNPAGAVSSSMGNNMGTGFIVGSLGGLANAGAVLAIDGDKIRRGEQAGVGAQIAGMAAGVAATEFGRTAFDGQTYIKSNDRYSKQDFIPLNKDTWSRDHDGTLHREGESVWVNKRTGEEFTSEQMQKVTGAARINKQYSQVLGDNKISEADAIRLYQKGGVAFKAAESEVLGRSYIDNKGNLYLPRMKLAPDAAAARDFLAANSSCAADFAVMGDASVMSQAQSYGWQPSYQAQVDHSTVGNSTLLPRLLIKPVVNTLNQWPAISGMAMALLATDGMQSEWKPLVYGVVSAASNSVFDSTATLFRMKPSLWGTMQNNIDTKLGFAPTEFIKREQLFGQLLPVQNNSEMRKAHIPEGVIVAKGQTGDEHTMPLEQWKNEAQNRYNLSGKEFSETEPAKMDADALKALAADYGTNAIPEGKLFPNPPPGVANNPQLVKEIEGVVWAARQKKIEAGEGFSKKDFQRVVGGIQLDLWRIWGNTRQVNLSNTNADAKQQFLTEQTNSWLTALDGKGWPAISCSSCPSNSPGSLAISVVSGGRSNEEIYNAMGGTRLKAAGLLLRNNLQYEVTQAALAGLINVGFNQVIDSAGMKNDTNKQLFYASLGTSAASIARGITAYAYGKVLEHKTQSAIEAGEFDPQVAAWRNVNDPVEILVGRLEGKLPMPKQFSVVGVEYEGNNGEKLSQKDIQAKVYDVKRDLMYSGVPIDLENQEAVFTPKGEVNTKGIYAAVENYEKTLSPQEKFKFEKENSALLGQAAALGEIKAFPQLQEGIATGKPQPAQQLHNHGSKQLQDGVVAGKPQVWSSDNRQQVNQYYYVKIKDGPSGKQVWKKSTELGADFKLSLRPQFYLGELSDASQFFYKGESVEKGGAYPIVQPPSLSSSIFGNLKNGLWETGWQSFAMGLPHTKGGKMSSYGWVNYQKTLLDSANNALSKGVPKAMLEHSIEVMKGSETSSSGVIQRYALGAFNNIPLGSNRTVGRIMGQAPFVGVSGYKGMPYSEAVISDQGYDSATTLFYPGWPHYQLSSVPGDPLAQYQKFSRYQATNIGGDTLMRNTENTNKEFKEKYENLLIK